MIIGLVPNTIYRVTVRAKNIRAPQFDDKTASDRYASHIDFRTLPKGTFCLIQSALCVISSYHSIPIRRIVRYYMFHRLREMQISYFMHSLNNC